MRSNRSSKKLLGRVLAMALAIIMTLGMPGVGQVFASAGDPEESIVQEVELDDVIVPEVVPDAPSGDTGAILDDTAQDGVDIDPEGSGADPGAPDAIPGDDAQDDNNVDPEGTEGDPGAIPDDGDIDPDAGNGDQEELPGGEPEEIPDETPDADLDADPDLITTALEAFRIQYQAFVNEFDTEKACHLDGLDHACAYRDFDGFLAAFEQASYIDPDFDITGEPDYIAMIDDLTAKLSEAAVSAYVFRGEGVLAASYDSLEQFDIDAGRMAGLVQYMLPADQGGHAITDMDGRMAAAREDLIAQLETPDEIIIPESVQAVLDRYEILCQDIDGMTFDSILAEIDRIEDLIRVILPEEMTEDVSAISGYLPEIRSQRALAEFCNKILTVREKAAAGAYDNTAENFDREAARVEFDAIRDLARYMLGTELSSENYANGLKILANLETLMDTPVDAGLSEKAEAWLAKFDIFQESFNIEYQNRPYALEKAVQNLLTECGQLDPSDMLDETIQAAKTTLDNMLRRIVIKSEIRGFLDAAYALLDAVNAGLDPESDECFELADRVVSAMDLLTESDMETVEISEAYQKLVDAGLVPLSDQSDPGVDMFRINASFESPAAFDPGYAGRTTEWRITTFVDGGSERHGNSFSFLFFDYVSAGVYHPDELVLLDTTYADTVRVFASTVSPDVLIDAVDDIVPSNNFDVSIDDMRAFVDANYAEVLSDGSVFALPDGVTSCMVLHDGTLRVSDGAPSVPDIRFQVSVDKQVGGFSIGEYIRHRFRAVFFCTHSDSDIWESHAAKLSPDTASSQALIYDFPTVICGRSINGELLGADGPVAGAEVALFSYDDTTGAYVRLERDVMGNRIPSIVTDANGHYSMSLLPTGDYYIAIKDAGMRSLVEQSDLIPVANTMHGLSGWQFVTAKSVHLKSRSEFVDDILVDRSNCLQNVVRDFRFEAELPPYEIDITWLDMADTTLSNDRTHADFVWSADNAYPVGSIRFDIQFNSDVPAGTALLYLDDPLLEYTSSDNVLSQYGVFKTCYRFRNNTFNVSGLTVSNNKIVTTDSFNAGTKLTIPIKNVVDIFVYYRTQSSTNISYHTAYPFLSDSTGVYAFTDGLNNVHELTFSRGASITSIDVRSGRGSSTSVKSPVGNTGARLRSWNPYVESVYGMTKDMFSRLSASDMLLFEYCYRVDASANAFAYLDLAVSPSGSGVVQSIYSEIRRNPALSDTWSGCSDYFVESPVDGFDFRMPVSRYNVSNHSTADGAHFAWARGSLENRFSGSGSGMTGTRIWILVSYPKDEILTYDAEKTEASCELTARVSLAEAPSVYKDVSHTEHHLEPLNQFISEGDMYSLHCNTSYNTGDTALFGAALLMGGNIEYTNINTMSSLFVANASYRFSEGSEPDTIALAVDAAGFTDIRESGGFSILGSGDYVLRHVRFDKIVIGNAYFDDSGNLITGSIDYDAYGDDEVQLYICTDDSPDEWVLDRTFHVRDLRVGTSFALTHDNVVRVKLVYPNRSAYVFIQLVVHCGIKNGPIVSELVGYIRDLPDDTGLSSMQMPFYASLHVIDKNGNPKLTKPASHISGTLAGDLNVLSSTIYGDWYDSGEYPLRSYGRVTFPLRGLLFEPCYAMSPHRVGSGGNSDIDYVDFAIGAKVPMSGSIARFVPEMVSGSNLDRLDSSDFYMVFPSWCEVVSVEPGIGGKNVGGASISAFDWPTSVGVPELDYEMSINEHGETELIVHTRLPYDRVSSLAYENGLYYGGFSVRVAPRYMEVFTQYVKVNGLCCINNGATYYRGDKIMRVSSDVGFAHTTCGNWHFADVNGDGDIYDKFVNSHFGLTYSVSGAAQSSGLQLAAQGSDNEFWNRTATTHAGDPYSYRLTYAQMAETSKNVVLFDSLEDISGNAWTGKLNAIDLSDARSKNLTVRVYTNTKNIDSVRYVQDNIAADDLSAGYDGWTLLTECSPSDPDSYQIAGSSLANIKSVAFDFGDQEFAKDQPGKPNVVQVYLRMKAPDSGFNNGSNAIQNRAFYSDVLTGSGKARSVMANTVTVDLVTTVSYNVTKTVSLTDANDSIGVVFPDGQYDHVTVSWLTGYTDTSILTMTVGGDITYDDLADLTPVTPSRYGYLFTGWHMDVDDSNGSITFTAMWELADSSDIIMRSSSGEWITSQDPDTGKLTIDKSGRPDNDLAYTYTLRFDMADPGKGKYESVSDLVLYDELESGTDSRYAGRLDGISITGLSYSFMYQDNWEVLPGASTMSLVPGYGDGTLGLLTVLDDSICDIYVSAAGTAGDTDLPDALASVTGRTDWIKTDIMLSNVDKNKITAVAVYCPHLTTANTRVSGGLTPLSDLDTDTRASNDPFDSPVYTPAYLEVGLSMTHAGHEDYTGVDRILKNGVTAGFVQMGASEPIIDTRPDQTEIEVVYKNSGIVLPVTGGPGVTALCVTGLIFLVPAAFVLATKKRKDQ